MSDKGTCGDKPGCEPKPRGYLEAETPSGKRNEAGSPVLHLGLKRRSLTPSQPEPQTPNITGRYEDEAGHFVLHINHCGNYLYVYYSQARKAGDADRTTISYSGLRLDDGFFVLRPHSDDRPGGSLSLDGGRLVMDFGGTRVPLVKITNEPVFSEFSMRGASERFRISELHPLTTSQRKRLQTAFDPKRIKSWLDHFFALGTTIPHRLQRQKMIKSLDEWVGRIFSTIPPNGMHPDDLVEFQLLARWHLRNHEHRVNGAASESLLSLLQRAVVESAAENSGFLNVKLWHIPKRLGIHDRVTSKYDAVLDLKGYQGRSGIPYVDVTYMRGSLFLKRITGPEWEAIYPIFISGVGVSWGRSLGGKLGSIQLLHTTGVAESSVFWEPQDVPGNILFGDLGGTLGAGMEGGAVGINEMVIFGSDLHPEPLSIDFSGFAKTARLMSLGIGGSVCYGQIYPSTEEENAPPAINEPVSVNTALNITRAVHFRMGDAWLTPAGRDAIGELCASELRALSNPATSITIHAHADRVDTAPNNDELSDLRAENVKRRILETSGEWCQTRNIETEGFGEQEATKSDEPDHTPNPRRRRADVTFNGHVTLQLWASDASTIEEG